MTEALREKLIKLNLDSKTLSRLEGFDDDVVERNLQLALERQPNSLAGFLVRACQEDWAGQAAPTPRVAPTPLPTADRKRLEKKLRSFRLERELILATPRVLAERFGGDWPLTDEEKKRLEVVETAIDHLEQALRT